MGNNFVTPSKLDDKKRFIKHILLSGMISKQHFMFELEEKWNRYCKNADLYINDMIENIGTNKRAADIVLQTLITKPTESIVLYETNSLLSSSFDIDNDHPIDLIIGIRILSDSEHIFMVYYEDVFLGEYHTKKSQGIIRFDYIIPYMILKIMYARPNIKIISNDIFRYRFVYATIETKKRRFLLQQMV